MANKIIKIICALLAIGQIAVFFPMVAQAQLGLCGDTPANPCFSSDANNGDTVGVTGLAGNGLVLAALSIPFTAYQGSLQTVQAFETQNSVAQLGLSASALITGSSALVGQLTSVIAAYNLFLTNAQLDLAAIANTDAPNVYTATIKQNDISQVNSSINTYKAKLQAVQAREKTAEQGFWKTLVISILLQTSKAVADTVVTKLVNNFKIANIKQYADSLATLAYDNQFIRQNFPDAQGQLMARAFLNNPLIRTQIQPSIFVAANAALGYNPSAVNPGSPSFYSQMAAAGSTATNPYYVQNSVVAGVDQSHASAQTVAQQQISQGSGYKAPVNCAGSLSQQKTVDAQAKASTDAMNYNLAQLNNLQNAQSNGQKVSAADINKAQAAYNTSVNNWNNTPDALGLTNPAVIMCEAVASPAVLVNQGIDAMFKGLGGNLSQYNSNNLPGYITAISGIASQIGTSLILGGTGAASQSALINENQTIAQTVNLANQVAAQNAANNSSLADGLVFSSSPGSGNSFVMTWQVITYQIPTASYVTITGTGAPTGKLPLTGSASITTNAYSNYSLTVYDASGKSLTNGTTYFSPPSTTTTSYNNTAAPLVAGAFTAKPVLDIRGPAVVVAARGQ